MFARFTRLQINTRVYSVSLALTTLPGFFLPDTFFTTIWKHYEIAENRVFADYHQASPLRLTWILSKSGRVLPKNFQKPEFFRKVSKQKSLTQHANVDPTKTPCFQAFFGRFSGFDLMSRFRETWVLELWTWVFSAQTWVFWTKKSKFRELLSILREVFAENRGKPEFSGKFDLSLVENLSFLRTWVFVKTSKKKAWSNPHIPKYYILIVSRFWSVWCETSRPC